MSLSSFEQKHLHARALVIHERLNIFGAIKHLNTREVTIESPLAL
jgi:hypothetical protein